MNNNNTKGVILVVDDDAKITTGLKGFFATLGYDMLTAFDGTEAVKVIDSVKNLDLILLDMRMPGVNGETILKKVRKERPKTKVIVMTAFDKEVKETVEKIGVDGFLPKPIDFSRLIDRIQYVLKAADKDTRFYPTKVTEKPTDTRVPKARLLFIEPDVMTFDTLCMHFAANNVKGEYEIKVIFSDREGLHPLYDYQPDIVIMYEGLYSPGDTEQLAGLMMSSSHKPRSLILHGLVPKMDYDVVVLKKEGIQFCNQNVMKYEQVIESNDILAEFIASECRKHGLVKK